MNKEAYSRTKKSKDDWETPIDFFKLLEIVLQEEIEGFSFFTLDPCASIKNTKCNKFYTKEDNGLEQDWKGGRVFVNPPFSDIKNWVKKCYIEGQKENTIVILILPSRTDTQYWHDYIMNAHEIWFCKGRVNFLKNGVKPKNGSTFPLSVIIFKKTYNKTPKIRSFFHK